jgi:hypothetical protein
MGCKRVMYQVLRVVLVDRGGGRIAKKSSGWKDRYRSNTVLHDKMHTMVPVSHLGVARRCYFSARHHPPYFNSATR